MLRHMVASQDSSHHGASLETPADQTSRHTAGHYTPTGQEPVHLGRVHTVDYGIDPEPEVRSFASATTRWSRAAEVTVARSRCECDQPRCMLAYGIASVHSGKIVSAQPVTPVASGSVINRVLGSWFVLRGTR